MTSRSNFLNSLNTEKDFFEGLSKQLRSNKILQRALENPEAKQAFIMSLNEILNELNEAEYEN